MVDGINPQTANLLREASAGNRPAQENSAQQRGSAQENDSGAARGVQDVSVQISAQGAQQSSAEQLTGQAVSDPSATDTQTASTFTSGDFGNSEVGASERANQEAAEQTSLGENGAVTGTTRQDADQALGLNIDTRA